MQFNIVHIYYGSTKSRLNLPPSTWNIDVILGYTYRCIFRILCRFNWKRQQNFKRVNFYFHNYGSLLFKWIDGCYMKIIVNNFCPVLNKINPAVLISDAFYSLSVYNTYNHYMKDIISLCILIVIFITGGFLYTRMKKFANYFRLCCILINPLDFVPACWWYNMWFYEKGILGLINSFVFLLISVSISLLLSTFSLQFSVYTL